MMFKAVTINSFNFLADKASDAAGVNFDPKARQTEALTNAYNDARKAGSIEFDNPVPLDLLIGTTGKCRRNFPLPNGNSIGVAIKLGLPYPSSYHSLRRIKYDDKLRGFWLDISCLDKSLNEVNGKILIFEDKSGKEAIILPLTLQKDALLKAYQDAKTRGSIEFAVPLNLDLLIRTSGTCQHCFPLPNGSNIGVMTGLGLAAPSSDHTLKSIKYDGMLKGFWLDISCLDRRLNEISEKVLILEDKSGKDALKLPLTLQRDALIRAYQDAKTLRSIEFAKPLNLNLLIARDSTCQQTFPLPNGSNIGAKIGLGLSRPSSDHILKSMEYEESKGFWLDISCLDKDSKIITSRVLILEGESGRDALKTSVALQREALAKAYQDAKTHGSHKYSEPIILDRLVGRDGLSQQSFPLPNGSSFGKNIGLGLPNPCSNPNLKNIEYNEKSKGFWLDISCIDKNHNEVARKVFVREEPLLADAINTPVTLQKKALINAYQKAKQLGEARYSEPLSLDLIIGEDGISRLSFPLPDGSSIGARLGLGLSRSTSNHSLKSIEYDKKLKGFWLNISCLDRKSKEINGKVLILEDKAGKEALKLPLALQRDAVVSAYQDSKMLGYIEFTEPLDLDLLIGKNGNCQASFPLANGSNIGTPSGMGLSKPSSNHKLKSIEYDEKLKGFWLHIVCLDKSSYEISGKVLVLEDKTGKEALKLPLTLQKDALLKAYQDAKAFGFTEFVDDLNLDFLIDKNGRSQQCFPLPEGNSIGEKIGLGLAYPSSHHNLKSLQYDETLKGYWLYISCLDRNSKEINGKVLILEDKSGREALKLPLTLQRDAVANAYQDAKLIGCLEYSEPLNLDLLFGKNGTCQQSFPLPIGSKIGVTAGLGLPSPSSNHVLAGIEYDDKVKGFWLRISCLDKNLKEINRKVLILEDRAGRDAIKLPQSLQKDALLKAYRDAKRLGYIEFNAPLNLDLLIRTSGQCQQGFPLPNGSNIGVMTGLGLATPSSDHTLKSIKYDKKLKGFWLNLSGLDKNSREISAKVLILEEKSGKDALKLPLTLQRDAVVKAYQDARMLGYIEFPVPLNLDHLIGKSGICQRSFPLPNGTSIESQLGFGLVSPSSNHNLKSINYDETLKGFWLNISCLDKDSKEINRKVLILDGKSGKDAIKFPLTLQRDAIVNAYQDANILGHIEFAKPLNLDLLFRIDGRCQESFPLPNGSSIGKNIGLGFSKKITSPCLNRIVQIKNDTYLMTLSAISDSKELTSDILVSNHGIKVLKNVADPAIEIQKGFCFDRYVSHLMAAASINAEAGRRYHGSALTNELFEPNFTSASTIIHSKWGNQGVEVFNYILKYGRLQRLYNLDALHLVATEERIESLKSKTREAAAILGFRTKVMLISDWASSLGLDSNAVEAEITRIETLAAISDFDELKERRYEPQLLHAKNQASMKNKWQDRVRDLCSKDNYEILIETLSEHQAIHSEYWERDYHINLAMHCSYLIDACLDASGLSQLEKDTVEKSVYEMYPELENYKNAWIFLADQETNVSTETLEGQGSDARLHKFSLANELEKRGAVTNQESQDALVFQNTLPEVVVSEYDLRNATERDRFWKKVKDIANDKGDPLKNAAELQSLSALAERHEVSDELKSFVTRIIRNAVLAPGNNNPEELLQTKTSTNDTDFVEALSNLPPTQKVEYLVKGIRKKISAAELCSYFIK